MSFQVRKVLRTWKSGTPHPGQRSYKIKLVNSYIVPKYFLKIDARFSGGGIMLYVAPLLDLDLNYSLQSIICWMR